MSAGLPPGVALRAATADDLDTIAALKESVLRADLERLGIWDPQRSRDRIAAHFSSGTRMILRGDAVIGTVTLRPEGDEGWLEMFYLVAHEQGRGLGGAILRDLLEKAATWRSVRLLVLMGSPARRLYERHGFIVEEDDGIDVWMRRFSDHQSADIRTR